MKECVTTATATVLVNGSPTSEFHVGRGLRQGDPLSSFMFLLAAEGVLVMMDDMVTANYLSGYKVGRKWTLSVSHL